MQLRLINTGGDTITESFFIRGILIGLLFGIPAGAVGTLTVQRTFRYGFIAGLKTGMGSTAADCLYAACGAFGLTFVSDFLLKYQVMICIAGGCLILGMGVSLFFGKEDRQALAGQNSDNAGMFLSSFAVGITNPAAVLTFMFAFSYFGISGKTGVLQGIQLVAGVFIGTLIWWWILSAGVVLIKKKTEKYSFRHMNQIFGTILILFGIVVFIRTLF